MPSFNSQCAQDLFVLATLNKKQGGTFLEIGSNDPVTINNTFVLESEFGWGGVMVEYDQSYLQSYIAKRPKSHYVMQDATKIDYIAELRKADMPTSIDYLQIDLDVDNRSTIDTLIRLDETVFDTYTFATVTFEHDVYRGNYFNTQKISREIFAKRGYVCVFKDVDGGGGPFEDWYVHPTLVDMSRVETFKSASERNHLRDIKAKLSTYL
jgi:hypothetical protein